ncbi:hypothetical protein HX001_16745 [Empedobacter brevis]|uniref:Uncharacterized protein n=1 Tax=Empedobacter brevis TaxID=247 RepID=A0AAJ1V953_9FLAO|nr:hypothetical protein [Empedobacter brevis]MDM1074134.1 hypothetical protein [Empedobacter brevis]
MNKNELKNNFKIPTNYFDDLKDKLYLNSLKQKENYTVPNNYFESLEQNVLTKAIKKKETKTVHFNVWWAAACVLFLALIVVPFVVTTKKTEVVVDTRTENQVYEKIYDSYIVSDQNKKSSNVALDDSDFVLYNY